MEQTPKYYRFSRTTIGHMNTATKILSRFSTGGISGSVLTSLSTLMAGTKVDLILPIVMGLVAFLAQTANDTLLYVISVSDIKDPIRTINSGNVVEAHT